ncbi:hypothetical protein MMC18_006306 [Xylographa bjoerkii]|nr:hypothetical protein [Xylographa bjoerkii]
MAFVCSGLRRQATDSDRKTMFRALPGFKHSCIECQYFEPEIDLRELLARVWAAAIGAEAPDVGEVVIADYGTSELAVDPVALGPGAHYNGDITVEKSDPKGSEKAVAAGLHVRETEVICCLGFRDDDMDGKEPDGDERVILESWTFLVDAVGLYR